MRRIVISFWLFFGLATLTGGLLGRYVAVMFKGYVTPGIVIMTLLLSIAAAFSFTVLLRILKALATVKRRQEESLPPAP